MRPRFPFEERGRDGLFLPQENLLLRRIGVETNAFLFGPIFWELSNLRK